MLKRALCVGLRKAVVHLKREGRLMRYWRTISVIVLLAGSAARSVPAQVPERIVTTQGAASSDEEAFDAVATADGVIITGYTTAVPGRAKDLLVKKIGPSGEVRWEKALGGTYDEVGYGLTATRDGGIVVTGYTMTTTGPGLHSLLLCKFSAEGHLVWTLVYENAAGDLEFTGNDVVEDASGALLVTGSMHRRTFPVRDSLLFVKFDESGNPDTNPVCQQSGYYALQLARNHYGNSITTAWDGGFLVAGSLEDTGVGGPGVNALVAHFDANCGYSWAKQFGADPDNLMNERAHEITRTSDGGYAFVGSYTVDGNDHGFIHKYGPNFVHQWSKEAAIERARSVIQVEDGSLVVMGDRGTPAAAFSRVFTVAGVQSSGRAWGASGNDVARRVIEDRFQDPPLWVVGYTDSSSWSRGGRDILVAKLSPSARTCLQREEVLFAPNDAPRTEDHYVLSTWTPPGDATLWSPQLTDLGWKPRVICPSACSYSTGDCAQGPADGWAVSSCHDDLNLNGWSDACEPIKGLKMERHWEPLATGQAILMTEPVGDFKTTLTWTPQEAALFRVEKYDIVTGDLGVLRSLGRFYTDPDHDSVRGCLIDDLVASSIGPAFTCWRSEPWCDDPPPGGGYWYLVRAEVDETPLTYGTLAARETSARDDEIDDSSNSCP